jgi:hypothetical protein
MTDYPAQPRLDCDVIMKGGITSGVICPRAMCELARTYRLRSVGGASAGAIAAAAAAAAEYGRTSRGFDKLEDLPDEIGKPAEIGGSVLFRLFQPTARTKGLFRVATAGLGKRKAMRTIGIALAVVRSFAIAVVLGAAPGIAALILALFGSGIAQGTAITASILLLLVGAVLGAALGIARNVGRAVPANDFGLCSGMPGPGRSGRAEALTPWLHRTLQDLAGRKTAGPPLTFGDLENHDCSLRVMTTNLTRRQPLAMPWSDQQYFFDENEFRDLFPADVVDWMKAHPPVNAAEAPRSLQPLPPPEHLPVLVATRMSLSFPFLLSAIRSTRSTTQHLRVIGCTGSPTAASAATCRCTSSTVPCRAGRRSQSTSHRSRPARTSRTASGITPSCRPSTTAGGRPGGPPGPAPAWGAFADSPVRC